MSIRDLLAQTCCSLRSSHRNYNSDRSRSPPLHLPTSTQPLHHPSNHMLSCSAYIGNNCILQLLLAFHVIPLHPSSLLPSFSLRVIHSLEAMNYTTGKVVKKDTICMLSPVHSSTIIHHQFVKIGFTNDPHMTSGNGKREADYFCD